MEILQNKVSGYLILNVLSSFEVYMQNCSYNISFIHYL